MANLTTCLQKVGAKLDPADKAAVMARSRELRTLAKERGEPMSATDAAIQAAKDVIAEIRAELKAAEPAQPAQRKSSHPKTVMGSELLALVSARLGGLDPAWLPEFSTRFATGKKTKDGTPQIQWRNPPIPGVGLLFRRGGTQDLSAIAQMLEEADYLESGSTERDYKEAGERAKDMIRAALNRDTPKTLSQQQAEMEAGQEAERKAYYDALDEESAAEADAERAAIMAEAGMSRLEIGAVDDDDLTNMAFTTDTATQMRAMGFTEQEIADELAREAQVAAAAAKASAGQDAQAGPEAAPAVGPAGVAAAQRGSEPAEGLTLEAQTPEALKAKATREKAAADADAKEQKRLAAKAKADAERDEFQLTGSDRAADVGAAAGQGDLLAGSSTDQAPVKQRFADNKVFTQSDVDAARALLKKKLGQLNSGIDPELMQAGITIAGAYIESGVRKFADFARVMVDDLGERVKPYLQSWYMAVRADPRAAAFRAEMDKASAIEDLDVDEVLAAPKAEPAPEPATPAEPAAAAPMPAVGGISMALAEQAHRGTSFTPERRAEQERDSFLGALREAWDRAARIAGQDQAAIDRITEVFKDVADGYRERYTATLQARSRVMSSMIAGPARFPVDRNRKRLETEQKRAEEAHQYLGRGIKRLLRAARGPIDNSPESELERVRLNLTQREEAQEQMKAANVALRKGDDAALEDLGFTAEQIAGLKKPDFAGRTGFPDYKLTNNNAEIRRLRERLKSAEDRMAEAAAGPVETERQGVRMVEDATDDRLRLIFDGKPDEEVRNDLKANGFRWSPKNEAWQRQLTDNARAAAKQVLNKHYPPEDGQPVLSQTPTLKQGPGRGVPLSTLKPHIDAIKAKMPGLRNTVEVVATVTDLPADIVSALRSMNALGTVRGLRMPDGRVFLVADKLDSRLEAEFVLFHEVYGHEGLRAILTGDEYASAMTLVRLSNKKVAAEADQWMSSYGADQIDARIQNGMTPEAARREVRLLAIEEALADRAGKNGPPSVWKNVMAAIQKALRRAGMNDLANWLENRTEAETYALLMQARKAITSPKKVHAFTPATSPLFQRAYHGTPARNIERFSTDFIGTGEGNQAYGYGLYFASRRDVAEYYRRALSGESDRTFTKDGKTLEGDADLAEAYYKPGRIVRGYSGADKVLQFKRNDNGGWGVQVVGVKANGEALQFERPRWHSTRPDGNTLRSVLEEDGWKPSHAGQTYEVEIPGDDELLLWDKPLGEQPANVREALAPFIERYTDNQRKIMSAFSPAEIEREIKAGLKTISGQGIYEQAGYMEAGGDRSASEYLSSLGVKGIKYLDGLSRDGASGSHNYVIFSGDDVAIQQALLSRRPPPLAPAVTVQPDENGNPEFAGDGVVLAYPQPAERFEFIPGPGQRLLNYAIMPAEGFDSMGFVELVVENGRVTSLMDIEVNGAGRRAGVGRKVIETILAANPDADVNISNIVHQARGFWAKMGVPEQNLEDGAAYDGTLNWQAYAQAANDGRAAQVGQGMRGEAGADDRGRQGADRRPASGAQAPVLSQKPAPAATGTPAPIATTAQKNLPATRAAIPASWRDPTNRLQFAPGEWLYNAMGRLAAPLLVKMQFKAATPEMRRQLRQMKLDVQKAQDVAVAVAGETTKLSEAEREMVSDIIEREVAAGTVPPAHAVRLAAMMNQAMGEQSKELVRLGMLTQEAADRWDGTYLPRFYESKLKKQVGDAWADAVKRLGGRTSAMRGVKGSHLKSRGIFEPIAAKDLDQWEQMGWEIRDPDYPAGTKAADLTARMNAGLLQPDEPIQMWRDYTRAERDKMGEIRDAGFRFVMGYMQTQRDIALGRMFEKMATDPAGSSRIPKEGWVQVPNTIIEGTGAKRYGKLSGRYVPKETLSHLSQIEESQSAAWQFYRQGMAIWKMGKTAMNPVSHMNNVLSNLTMAQFAGVGYHRADKYVAAIKDFATAAPAIKEARDAGLFLGTMSDAELMNTLPKELQELAGKAESSTVRGAKRVFDLMTFFLRKPMGAAYQAEDTFFRYLIYKDARGRGLGPDDAIDYAQKFIFTYDDLPKGARMVRDFGIPFFAYTYKAVPALLSTALTHPVRFAAPAAVLWAANAMAYAIAAGDDDDTWPEILSKYLNDEDFRAKVREQEKLERENLPPWMKGTTALSTPKAIRLGMDEVTKLPLFIDVARIIPGGDIFDVSPNAGGIPLPQPITPSHPLFSIATGMIANKDLWTGKDLVDKNDTRIEAAEKRSEWMWKQISPAMAIGNYHWERGMNALAQASGGEIKWLPEFVAEDYTGVGRDRLPVQPGLAAMQTFGIKVRPIDIEKSIQMEGTMREKMIRDITAEYRTLSRLNQAGVISDTRLEKERAKTEEKVQRLREGLTVDGDERP